MAKPQRYPERIALHLEAGTLALITEAARSAEVTVAEWLRGAVAAKLESDSL